jgi:hypothetical protein
LYKNCGLNNSGEIIIFDFESVYYTRAWFLLDIVNLSVIYDFKKDTGDLIIRDSLIETYLRTIYPSLSINNYLIRTQIKLILARFIINRKVHPNFVNKLKRHLLEKKIKSR